MMTSNKPYLIRALYEWLVDNDATPYILVNSRVAGVSIPPGIDKDGQVILNIAMRAVSGLQLLNSHIEFSARFSGVSQQLYIPMNAVQAIYSMEDGQGMMFTEEETEPAQSEESTESTSVVTDGSAENKNKPGLKIVR